MKSLDSAHRKYSISGLGNSEADRLEFMINNMHLNKAYLYKVQNIVKEIDKKKYRKNFQSYCR